MKNDLTVILGPMYAGKTSYAISLYEQNLNGYQIFKPVIDNRYGSEDFIYSHNKTKAPAILFNPKDPGEILDKLNWMVPVVVIDEVQFCSSEIISVVDKLRDIVSVVVIGLDLDSDKNKFGHTLDLAEKATTVHSLKGVCYICNNEALFTKALFNKKEQTVVGGQEKYAPTCEACWAIG